MKTHKVPTNDYVITRASCSVSKTSLKLSHKNFEGNEFFNSHKKMFDYQLIPNFDYDLSL